MLNFQVSLQQTNIMLIGIQLTKCDLLEISVAHLHLCLVKHISFSKEC